FDMGLGLVPVKRALALRRTVRLRSTGESVLGFHKGNPGQLYSIISSASTSNSRGIASPNADAVLPLITRSNLVGCSTGKSAGLPPLSILSTYVAARR